MAWSQKDGVAACALAWAEEDAQTLLGKAAGPACVDSDAVAWAALASAAVAEADEAWAHCEQMHPMHVLSAHQAVLRVAPPLCQ